MCAHSTHSHVEAGVAGVQWWLVGKELLVEW